MKLLVTGGLGFIGSNFILQTLKNYREIEIINIDAGFVGSNHMNLIEIENSQNYKFVKGNIGDSNLMNKLITELKGKKEIVAPDWAQYVKTGAHKQRPPVDKDWWHVRAASVLRKILKFGPVGTNRLAKQYGGRKDRGHKPEKKYRGSRNIVRKCLQQLEKAKLIKQVSEPRFGKIVTKEGNKFLTKTKE